MSSGAGALWRPMLPADLAAVDRVGGVVHPLFPERPEIAAERLRLFPEGCFVAEGSAGLAGYCVAHPAMFGEPVPLDTVIGRLPDVADCLYVHDVALLQDWRGNGLGHDIIRRLKALAEAKAYGALALMAVNGSAPYWERLGFIQDDAQLLRENLAGYGADARYMHLRIPSPEGI